MAVSSALVLGLAAAGLACAPLRSANRGPNTPTHAATALAAGDFEAARELLAPRAACTGSADGREALLLLASLELDPRNPKRSPAAATARTALYLRLPDTPPAGRTVARTLHLLALEIDPDSASRSSYLNVPAPAVGRTEGAAGTTTPLPETRPPPRASRGELPDCPQVPAEELLAFEPPVLPARTLHQRVRSLETQRDELARRLRASEDGRRALETQLAEITEELTRIRRILRQ